LKFSTVLGVTSGNNFTLISHIEVSKVAIVSHATGFAIWSILVIISLLILSLLFISLSADSSHAFSISGIFQSIDQSIKLFKSTCSEFISGVFSQDAKANQVTKINQIVKIFFIIFLLFFILILFFIMR
jgi:Cu/Ag efflux pump CusA